MLLADSDLLSQCSRFRHANRVQGLSKFIIFPNMLNASYYSPPVYGAYIAPASLFSPAYSDAQRGCLIAGFLTAAFLLSIYASGRACPCFRAFDIFSSELELIEKPDEQVGYERERIRAVPVTRKFGGVIFWSGIAGGLALCGDALSYVAQRGWVEESSTLPSVHPLDGIGAATSFTLRLRAVRLSPTTQTCAVNAPRIVGALSPSSSFWSIRGESRSSIYSTAASFNGSLIASSLEGSTVLNSGCDFTFETPALIPGWQRFSSPSAADAVAPKEELTAWANAQGGVVTGQASAFSALGVTPAMPPGALLSFSLPAGFALVSWDLKLSDGASYGSALTELGVGEICPLPGARGNGAGDGRGGGSRWGIPLPPMDISNGLTPLFGRAHALRLRLIPSRFEDKTVDGVAVGFGFRGSALGSASVGVEAASPVLATSFVDSFTISLDISEYLISTLRSPRLSVVLVLGILSGLVFLSLFAARVVHDVLDSAFDARLTTHAQGAAYFERIGVVLSCGWWRPIRSLTSAPSQKFHADVMPTRPASSRFLGASSISTTESENFSNADLDEAEREQISQHALEVARANISERPVDPEDSADVLPARGPSASRMASLRKNMRAAVRTVGLFSMLRNGAAKSSEAESGDAGDAAPPNNPLFTAPGNKHRKVATETPEQPQVSLNVGGFEGGHVPGVPIMSFLNLPGASRAHSPKQPIVHSFVPKTPQVPPLAKSGRSGLPARQQY